MNTKFLFFILILVAVFLEILADIFFKRWSLGNKHLLLGVGLLFYFVGTVFWAFSLRYHYLFKAVSIFTILNLIAVTLAGVVLFNEQLSLANKIGIFLGILSIFLVEL
ncbi:hypothetical protein HYS50_01500 [Candidatus Woesearchaeota archaeon]|nr:hypothetical protein [Candidatus Woesearchaeota archaeon]